MNTDSESSNTADETTDEPSPRDPAAEAVGAALLAIADEVRSFDPDAANRLTSLHDEVVHPAANPRWAGVDVIRAIDPPGVAAGLQMLPLNSPLLGHMERLRNILVLIPIFLTWLGLLYAAIGYQAAISADPSLVTKPFLLLWQESFYGHVPSPFSLLNPLTLSHVALIDAIVLALLIGLTWRIHSDLNIAKVTSDQHARLLERRLHQAAWHASTILAQRATPESIATRLRILTETLLDDFRAQHARLDELRADREKELQGLAFFSTELREGAAAFAQHGERVAATADALLSVTESLDQRTAHLDGRDQTIQTALEIVGESMIEHTNLQRSAGEQLIVATGRLQEAANQTSSTVTNVASSMRHFASGADQIMSRLSSQQEAQAAATSAAARAMADLESAIDAMIRGSKDLTDDFKVIRDLVLLLRDATEKLDQTVVEQRQGAAALAEAAGQITGAVEGIAKPTADAADAMVRSASELSSIVSSVRQLAVTVRSLEVLPDLITRIERQSRQTTWPLTWWRQKPADD